MNGGQCIQYSPPDNYTCNCTGTRFQGVNCTVSDLVTNGSCPANVISLFILNDRTINVPLTEPVCIGCRFIDFQSGDLIPFSDGVWRKGSTALSDGDFSGNVIISSTSNTLFLTLVHPATVVDVGDTLTCSSSSASQSHIITIGAFNFLNPRVSPNGTVSVIEGSNLTLTCSDPGNSGVPRYVWINDSDGSQLTVIINNPPLTLHLTNINRAASGNYTCRSTNTELPGVIMDTTVTLNVQFTNTPPVIEASDTFMITVGETALYTLHITDPGDTISVTIDGEFPYTLDQNGSIWTLNVTLSSLVEFNFTVIATDSFNETSKITPQVIICSCTIDRGNCTIDEYENNTSNLLILMCDCMEAYEGEYCEDDFDGCTEISCFNDATCTDVPAPGTGATCPPCPSGYTGDGIVCSNESTSEFLPFLYPSSYNVYTNVDDGSVDVTLPTTLDFGGFHYNRAYISSNGLVSFGRAYNSFSPRNFPLQNSLAVVAPYWDDSRLSGSRQLRYQIVSGSSSLITEVNAFLSNYTGDTFEADWLLWAYWHDICPYSRGNCQD
uniref:Ig-like domain-containing protein n=1 Tax=Amphimedon queenslandica TaxID=400682 RepID=A0A1X7TQH6_AMPQE